MEEKYSKFIGVGSEGIKTLKSFKNKLEKNFNFEEINLNQDVDKEYVRSLLDGIEILFISYSSEEAKVKDIVKAISFMANERRVICIGLDCSLKENKDDINTKRDFLTENKILEVNSLQEMAKTKEEQDLLSPDSYRTTVRVNRKLDKNREVSNSIIKSYLDILNQYYKENMFDYLEERKDYLEKSLPILKKQLEDNAVSSKITVSSGGTGTTENNYFKYIYPIQVSNIDTYYEKYKTFESEYQSIKTLIDLELNKSENFIKYDSSIITVKEKSGNITKLLIGIVLSLCLAIFSAFIKEFIEGYKKNKNNN